jgi:predicted aldo/keto reductase-like oxidoreductase
MLYRELGQTGEKISILSFGCMRLPVINDKADKIDEKKANEMLSYGIDNGINYLDTGYPYHGTDTYQGGESEPFLGNFLSTGYREKVLIATKLPSWAIEKKEDMEYYIDLQLERLQVNQIDVYLIHSVKTKYWENLTKLDVLDFMDQIKSDGKVKYVGFSFHDDLDLLLEVIDSYNWDVVQTQMNYLDENYQSGINGLQYINALNLGNIIMEPLRGGKLVNNIPSDVNKLWQNFSVKKSPADWAFRYLYNMKEVDTVISGMSTLKQVKENIAIASQGYPDSLTEEEIGLIKEVSKTYKRKKGNNCTMCGYCMPCPFKVNIPSCLNEYNIAMMLNDVEASSMHYFSLIEEESLASACNDCKKCIPLCTQMINIPEELEKVKTLFGK